MECAARRSPVLSRSVAVAVLGAVLLIAGCGGDGEGETTAVQGDAQQATTTQAADAGREANRKGGGSRESSASQQGDVEGVTPPPDAGPTPGSKSAASGVPVNPGGDNSVQTYGSEATDAERRQAATTLKGYLNDRAAGRWVQACLLLATPTRREIGRFSGTGAGGEEALSCPQGLRALTEGVPPAALRDSAQINLILSFRTQGHQGFLLFNGPPDRTLYSTTMAREGGRWKVASLAPTALPV